MTSREQIRNLMIVASSGMSLSIFVIAFLVWNYSPSDHYELRHVLLSPETIGTMDKSLLTFDHADYTSWNQEAHRWEKKIIPLQAYKQFYDTIQKDKSINPIEADYHSKNLSHLTLFIRDEKKSSFPQVRSLQMIEFASNGNGYRVKLNFEGKDGWAYFEHSNIQEWMKKNF